MTFWPPASNSTLSVQKQLDYQDERQCPHEERLRRINQSRSPLSLMLAGVSDVRNIGALFRLADAARLSHLYFLGAPGALYHKKVARVARSADQYVPASALTMEEALALGRAQTLIGLEITSGSIPYTSLEIEARQPAVLVIGHEALGIPESILGLCSTCIHLPMYGINTSMNAAMAAGIAVYELLRKGYAPPPDQGL